MKKRAMMAVLAGVLSVLALGIAAQHVFAAVTWGGTWGQWVNSPSPSTCTAGWTGIQPGTGVVNGNDPGQDLAYCYAGGAWTCGTQASFQFYVHTSGYNYSLNQFEPVTAPSNGPSVGSTAGGFRIDATQCQMGYGPR